MLFSYSVIYRAIASEPLFGQFLRGLILGKWASGIGASRKFRKKEGTESELLNGSRESDGFSHNQAYRAFQRDGLQVLPPSFSKPSFRFLFAEDVAPYACEKLARHKGSKERLGVLRVGPEIGD